MASRRVTERAVVGGAGPLIGAVESDVGDVVAAEPNVLEAWPLKRKRSAWRRRVPWSRRDADG